MRKIANIKKIDIKKTKLIPDIKINNAHEKTISNVWPISGWIIRSREIKEIKIVESEYFNKIFVLLLQNIVARVTIKNGFNTSIGWNRGKKYKSNHLLDPFTSIPIMGTKNNEIKNIKKRKIENLYNLLKLSEEKIKITTIPSKT